MRLRVRCAYTKKAQHKTEFYAVKCKCACIVPLINTQFKVLMLMLNLCSPFLPQICFCSDLSKSDGHLAMDGSSSPEAKSWQLLLTEL